MKGFFEEIGSTAIVLIAVLFMLVMAFVAFIALQFPMGFSGTKASSVDYLAMSNDPYILATELSHLRIGDRNFVEYATEIAVTESLKNVSSVYFSTSLRDFVNSYGNGKAVTIVVKKGGRTLYYLSNYNQKCGDKLEGFCTDACGTGRKKIDDSSYTNDANKCIERSEICCVPDYSGGAKFCGTPDAAGNKPGVCKPPGEPISGVPQEVPNYNPCNGEVKIYDISKDCANGYDCCVPSTQGSVVESDAISAAQIPLLYKNSLIGYAEVTIG